MMVGKHEIETFEVVVVVLLLLLLLVGVFDPTSAQVSLIICGQVVCPNILRCLFIHKLVISSKKIILYFAKSITTFISLIHVN